MTNIVYKKRKIKKPEPLTIAEDLKLRNPDWSYDKCLDKAKKIIAGFNKGIKQ